MRNALSHGKLVAAVAFMTSIAGCAVPLTPEAEKVRLVTASEKERCERIKLVTINQSIGPDKSGNAMKNALNETAVAGGNGFYLISSSNDWAAGASVIGEALSCKR